MPVRLTRAPHQKATMTGAQFKALRLELGLKVRDLACLLVCSEQTIRQIESPRLHQRISRQIEQMMCWLRDPVIRQRVQALRGQEQD